MDQQAPLRNNRTMTNGETRKLVTALIDATAARLSAKRGTVLVALLAALDKPDFIEFLSQALAQALLTKQTTISFEPKGPRQ